MAFEVIRSGLLSLIVDEGRDGFMHKGYAPSGALDLQSYRMTLLLLGDVKSNAVEVMPGLALLAHADTLAAIGGADLDATLNGEKLETFSTFRIRKGDLLEFRKRVKGMRAYLSVKGGFLTKRYLGSFSVSIREKIGSPLVRGQKIDYTPFLPSCYKRIKRDFIPRFDAKVTILKATPSYQYDAFDKTSKECFFGALFRISPQSNRTGFLLEGQKLSLPKKSFHSEPNAFGTVQILGDGRPVVLSCERQTIGGYAKIATVQKESCYILAQLPPGSEVKFEPI